MLVTGTPGAYGRGSGAGGGLLDAVRQGDEDAFRRLVGPYRAAIHAHRDRMLGSLFDADDALQDDRGPQAEPWDVAPSHPGRRDLAGAELARRALSARLDVEETRD